MQETGSSEHPTSNRRETARFPLELTPDPLSATGVEQPINSGPGDIVHSGACLHQEKLSRLRVEWLEKELCRHPPPSMISPSFSTTDSGIGTSSSAAEASANGQRSRVLCIDLDEDMLIASIQNEAETTQHMVDMVASTKSMKRRKQAFDDMTYRRRSVKAKQSLSSYTPVAPCHANWGNIFDDMIDELRRREMLVSVYECDECKMSGSSDNDSFYDNEGVSNSSRYDMDMSYEEHNPIRPSWLVSSVSDYVLCDKDTALTIEQKTLKSSPSDYIVCDQTPGEDDGVETSGTEPAILSDTEEFWEENWSDTRVPSSSGVEKLTPSSCDGCEQKTQSVIKPTFCYMNQKCPGFDTSATSALLAADDTNGTTSFLPAKGQAESLRNITFHRPDLASFTLPLSPIRKTESNSHVWIERVNEEPQAKAEKDCDKPSIWKRLKKLFR